MSRSKSSDFRKRFYKTIQVTTSDCDRDSSLEEQTLMRIERWGFTIDPNALSAWSLVRPRRSI